jgi:DNA (cytosine-5)-methyltransferase 1
MRYLSICSGIEAATVAWHHMGWQPVGFAEIEKFPSQVLAHHYPGTPNFGDLTKHEEWNIESGAVDLLVGGTPCQAFSVAGLRRGMDDERGQLTLEFVRLAARLRPRWIVWENVPGVLSSAGGRDFGSFLGALGQLGYGYAYRVLDAQFFGVAQRRRRVFFVGYLGDWRPAAAVLFERESLRRNPAPRRQAWEGSAAESGKRAAISSGSGADVVGAIDCRINAQRAQNAQAGHLVADVVGAIDCNINAHTGQNAGAGHLITAKCITRGEGYRYDSETCNLLPVSVNPSGRQDPVRDPSPAITRSYAKQVDNSFSEPSNVVVTSVMSSATAYPINGMCINKELRDKQMTGTGESNDPMYTLRSAGAQHAVAFHENQRAEVTLSDTAGSLKVGGGKPGQGYPAVMQPIAFSAKDHGADAASDIAPTLRAMGHAGSHANGGGQMAVATTMQVRRLTPVECERLQGFPDGYTDIRPRGKDTPDGPRYKALGNSMAVPVMRWIGERIAEVEKLQSTERKSQ